jgi:hypothetical protein
MAGNCAPRKNLGENIMSSVITSASLFGAPKEARAKAEPVLKKNADGSEEYVFPEMSKRSKSDEDVAANVGGSPAQPDEENTLTPVNVSAARPGRRGEAVYPHGKKS